MAALGRPWFPPPHVGGPAVDAGKSVLAKGEAAAELAKQGLVLTDDMVRDIPLFKYAISLQDTVFAIADELGVGPEVRAGIYAIRGAEYAATIAGNVLPPATAAAGASLLTGIGSVAALGAIAAVGLVVLELLGGDDEEEKQKRVKRAQAEVLHLRDRLTLAQFAAEQDGAAGGLAIQAQLAVTWPFIGNPAELQARSVLASKLADFYEAAGQRLSGHERALFESLSNLARWQGAINAYEKLTHTQKDNVDILLGKSANRLDTQLSAKIEGELETTRALVQRTSEDRTRGAVALGFAVAGGAAGAYFLAAPGAARALALGAARALARLYLGTRRAIA